MRKALIATIVAAGLFAVGAFAAEFALTADDVASGADDVGRCAVSASVEWNTTLLAEGEADAGEFYVESADVTFEPDEGKTCDGAGVELSANVDGTWVEGDCGDVEDEQVNCTFGDNEVPVGPLDGVAVLANGSDVATSL